MAIPSIKLNLVLPKSFWRTYHFAIGWATLVLGSLVLIFSTFIVYRAIIGPKEQTEPSAPYDVTMIEAQLGDVSELQNVDIAREPPVWQLVERVYVERRVTLSKLAEAIGRGLPQDVRIISIRRYSFSGGVIKVEIVGEALSRRAEVAFMESLKKNKLFEQVMLEKESERQGVGILFTYMASITSTGHSVSPD